MTAVVLGAVAGLVAHGLLRAPPATVRRLRAPSRHRPRRTPWDPAGAPAPRRPAGRRLRLVAVVVLVAAFARLAPVLLLALALGCIGLPRLRARRAQRDAARELRRALPDLVDLLRLATTAGLTLPIAQPLVAAHVPGPLGAALRRAEQATARGRPRADALVEALAPLGERAAALAHLLGDHLRYGVPLLPGLERTSLELRLDRRLAAEVDARRVPVRLLAPLVTCVLPAFALLTVVPLLAASLEALPL